MLLLERRLLDIGDALNQKTREHDGQSQNTDRDIDWVVHFDRTSVSKEGRGLEEVDAPAHNQHGYQRVERRKRI